MRVTVVGGGISGLTVAFELAQRAERFPWPLELICLERGARPGGTVQSERHGGFLCERGPTGFLDNAPATLTLARRLGLAADLLPARESARRRYLYRRKQLHELPSRPAGFLRSGLLSWPGKLRVLAEPFVSARSSDEDETIHDFVTRRIGREAAETLVDAMVSGIWGGDTRALSLAAAFPKMAQMEREHGGLFRAMRKRDSGGPMGPGGTLTSFRNGMQMLPDRLAAELGERLRLETEVRAVSDLGQRGFRVHLAEGAPIETDAVVLTTPAYAAAEIVREMNPAMAAELERIPYTSMAVVHLGMVRDPLDTGPSGFGFLSPRSEGLRILGSLWPADIFPGRAPEGLRLMTTMIGGAHDTTAVEMNDATLIQRVRDDLHQAIGAVVAPRFQTVVRHARAIPQYTLGHLDRVARIEALATDHDGFAIAGNSLHGISVNHCVEQAAPIAEKVLERLGQLAGA